MKRNTSLFRNIGLLLLRVVPSAAMLTHGIPKLEKLIDGNTRFSDPLGIGSQPSLILAVIGEVLAPILIMVGLKTRISAIPAAITMGVALFMVHWDDPFKKQELALLYFIIFVVLIFIGGGDYSIDGQLPGKKRRRKY